MSSSSGGGAPKQSFAPGGGKFKPVKETGFLAGLSSGAAASAPPASYASAPSYSSAPAPASYASSPAARSRSIFNTDSSSGSSYLDALSNSPEIYLPKESFGWFGKKYGTVLESGYLAGLTVGGSLRSGYSGPTPKDSPLRQSHEHVGDQYKEIYEHGSPADLSSSQSEISMGYGLGRALDNTPNQNYAPGGTSYKISSDDSYLGSMSAQALPGYLGTKRYRASAMPEVFAPEDDLGFDAPYDPSLPLDAPYDPRLAFPEPTYELDDMHVPETFDPRGSFAEPDLFERPEMAAVPGTSAGFDRSPIFELPHFDDYDQSSMDQTFEVDSLDGFLEDEVVEDLMGFCPYVVDDDLQGASLVDYNLHTIIGNKFAAEDKLIVLQRLGGHNLEIDSFEVELAANAAGDFGWTMYDTDFFMGNIVVDQGYIAGSLFVGPDQPVEVTIYSTENTERIKTTTLIRRSDKTVIRCANRGAEWYVNDQLVATTPDFAKGICAGGVPAPYVGIQTGSFTFTKLDYVQ